MNRAIWSILILKGILFLIRRHTWSSYESTSTILQLLQRIIAAAKPNFSSPFNTLTWIKTINLAHFLFTSIHITVCPGGQGRQQTSVFCWYSRVNPHFNIGIVNLLDLSSEAIGSRKIVGYVEISSPNPSPSFAHLNQAHIVVSTETELAIPIQRRRPTSKVDRP